MESDGVTRGQFQGFNHQGNGQDNARIHMDIMCLMVSGDQADIGGIITGASENQAQFLGQMASFTVVDGGQGQGAIDEISSLSLIPPCDTQLTVAVDKGNIQVRSLD